MSTPDPDWWTTRAAAMAAIDPGFAGEIDRLAEDQVDLAERLLRLQPGDRILDLGCGAGRHAILLQERGYHLAGLDLSVEVLALARAAWQRRHGAEDGPRWVQGDMREPPVMGPFDVVMSMDAAFGVFQDDAEHLAVLVGAAERLAPGGRLLVEVANPYFWARHQHTRHYPPGSLAADAHIVRTYRFDADLGRIEDHLTVFRGGAEPQELPVQWLRAWVPTELKALVQAAGFQDVRVVGMDGWRVPAQARPLDPANSAFMWVLARI
jgi:SAM-dependent methyltransferase